MRDRGPLARLRPQPPDALLGLIASYAADSRPSKLDLGVGEYRDLMGKTPIFRAVKAAEGRLLETQTTKSYLGPSGDRAFLDCVLFLLFGSQIRRSEFSAVQTPGGSGALRLAAALLHRADPDAAIWIGEPAWPNYAAIFEDAGVQIRPFSYFDRASQTVCFDNVMKALDSARTGDAFLLQGCCHNPTGADLTPVQWRLVTAKLAQNRLLPVLDVAYHGLGSNLDDDATGVRMVVEALEDVLIAYSCDKNFGLYRDRAGALFVRSTEFSPIVQSNIERIARGLWSMPPDHGGAIVRTILEDAGLCGDWISELASMRASLQRLRTQLAVASDLFAPLADQKGLFALLQLTKDQIASLRHDSAIYMADSGRINVAGLMGCDLLEFARNIQEARNAAAIA